MNPQAAQKAITITRSTDYQLQLAEEIHTLRTDPGVQKVLDLAREKRAHTLLKIANGRITDFEANQATYKAWDWLVCVIEAGPKTAVST